ncbi:MAG TPA: 3-hydroxyacyl-ACP dehydratase FabZ [Desulfuromonadales bacterium]|nr:3-hydroxyacyl-ACP dehydratase FabZ [Desulfuromonadales bacterium]
MLDINDIMKILPHRPPFLLVDRVTELEQGKRIVAIKNVTMNEPFFPGHFPGHPVMPGVLIIEALAQAACILAIMSSDESVRSKVTYFASIDNARFRKPVIPGDQLSLEIEATGCKRGIWIFSAKALVDGKLVTEAELKAAFADKNN